MPQRGGRKELYSKLSSILAEGSLNLQKAAHTFTGKILTEGDCYTPSDKALILILCNYKNLILCNYDNMQLYYSLFLASMRLPSPSETDRQRPRKKPSGASYLHGWGISRAGSREAATANGTASQRKINSKLYFCAHKRGICPFDGGEAQLL